MYHSNYCMKAIFSSKRSRLLFQLFIAVISIIRTTNSWGKEYCIQKQDSITATSVDSFIAKNQVNQKYSAAIKEFYASNQHEYVWIQNNQINQHAKDFIIHANKLAPNSIDSSFVEQLTKQNFSQNNAASDIDLSLSLAFFTYAEKWLMPSDIDPTLVKWRIPKISLPLVNQLKNWLNPATITGFNTGSQNFKQLLENFVSLSSIAALDTGINIPTSNIKINNRFKMKCSIRIFNTFI